MDPHLAGRKLELRFDPFDLSQMEAFLDGRSLGHAAVVQQGREKHIAVAHLVTQPPQPPKPKSSLDYLAALRAERATLFLNDANYDTPSEFDYKRLQLDMNYKF